MICYIVRAMKGCQDADHYWLLGDRSIKSIYYTSAALYESNRGYLIKESCSDRRKTLLVRVPPVDYTILLACAEAKHTS